MIELFNKPVLEYIFGKVKRKESKISKTSEMPKLYYEAFSIKNFKGLKTVEISFKKNDLLLLLGLNESGKTTILKAIETFDFLNDPTEKYAPKFYSTLKKKSDVNTNTATTITATINLESNLEFRNISKLGGQVLSVQEKKELENFVNIINNEKSVQISRVIPFKDGNPQPYFYQFEHKSPFAKSELSRALAFEIVHVCPFVIYFEDFKDRIPEEIFINELSDAYDPIWYDIIDGLFYNTNKDYSIDSFKKYYSASNRREQDAKIVLKQVNKTLNKVFTSGWKKLSGVKGIDSAELDYNSSKKCFQLNVFDSDGSSFTPEERSRGAIWYLSFLMKTEFRSKKLRKSSGKPIYLIDEPASNLHSTAQVSMIGDFMRLTKETSIIYTTHSQYLISLENIKNTYIIKKGSNGIVKATKWSDFLQNNQTKESYYQPIANLLQLIPNSLDIPWKKAILTEGPSDRKVLLIMSKVLDDLINDYAIYPGSSANHLRELIALNIGWNTDFKVFLDSDEEGMTSAEKYREYFQLDEEIVTIPKENCTIEKCFSDQEKQNLYKLSFNQNKEHGKISKKEFEATFSLLLINNVKPSKIKECLSDNTIKLFENIFSSLLIS
ncbi:AAA family ATPase [uncultured Roseivirga sp.]|uniref:ATP-dependent nuclease n=1 Tax=uncultured Roseivirga sp. TaxID=543088 RepID=UPI0030D9D51E|tara:strand:+ start:36276 stop:38102 length:1827 start_codon:yes stop_codon:yes gene_type:complete